MRMLLRARVLGLLVIIGLGSGPLQSAEDPMRVTTATPDYCVQLRSMVDEFVARTSLRPAAEVLSLMRDGEQMCGRGQVRGGISRLRRALMMLRATQGLGGG
jgi:hypothetical protein